MLATCLAYNACNEAWTKITIWKHHFPKINCADTLSFLDLEKSRFWMKTKSETWILNFVYTRLIKTKLRIRQELNTKDKDEGNNISWR